MIDRNNKYTIIKREIGEKVVFEVNNKVVIRQEQGPEEFLRDFLDVPKIKKPLTTKEIKKEFL